LQLAGITADWVKAPDADNIRARDDERILQNADLTAQPDEKETELQNQLTASFSAEQLALALIRQHRRDLTAPEELGEAGDMNMAGEMKTYRWFSLSAGKGQDIHVRGLLSLLSGRGGVKSSDVGDIYLHHSESHVAIAEQALSSFLGRLKDGHLTDDIKVTQIDSPIIPEGRDKAKRRQNKPSFGQKRQRRSSSWRPDERTERLERSGSKRHKPLSKEKSFSKKKPIRKDKSDQPGQADETFKEKKKRRKLPKSDKSERQNGAEKQSKAGQTLSIGNKGRKPHKPKQGGFKPVRRKSSR